MAKFNNAMEVFKLLKKDNCRDCGKPTCLAFAGAVFQGQMTIDQCPHIDREIVKSYGTEKNTRVNEMEAEYIKKLENYKKEIQGIDLELRAEKTGGRFEREKLIIKIMGKDFSVDKTGELSTDIHINPWISIPFYEYVLRGKGLELTSNWVQLRELENGADWNNFFKHQCEKPMKEVADNYTNFFEDIIKLFKGEKVENHYDADIALIIYPFPKVPMLICYNEPEDGLGSDLNLFFDETASENLGVELLYRLGTGVSVMFEKLSRTHG